MGDIELTFAEGEELVISPSIPLEVYSIRKKSILSPFLPWFCPLQETRPGVTVLYHPISVLTDISSCYGLADILPPVNFHLLPKGSAQVKNMAGERFDHNYNQLLGGGGGKLLT